MSVAFFLWEAWYKLGQQDYQKGRDWPCCTCSSGHLASDAALHPIPRPKRPTDSFSKLWPAIPSSFLEFFATPHSSVLGKKVWLPMCWSQENSISTTFTSILTNN